MQPLPAGFATLCRPQAGLLFALMPPGVTFIRDQQWTSAAAFSTSINDLCGGFLDFLYRRFARIRPRVHDMAGGSVKIVPPSTSTTALPDLAFTIFPSFYIHLSFCSFQLQADQATFSFHPSQWLPRAGSFITLAHRHRLCGSTRAPVTIPYIQNHDLFQEWDQAKPF